MVLTLGFQCKILDWLYLRNGNADCLGTEHMGVHRMSDPLCGMADRHGEDERWWDGIDCWAHYVTLTLELIHCFELGFSRIHHFQIAINQNWEGRLRWNNVDVSQRRCWTEYATFTFDPNHDLKLNFIIVMVRYSDSCIQEWMGRLIRSEKDKNRQDDGYSVWPYTWS